MSYSAPSEEVEFDGLLFDMDGTIIDSTQAVVEHWTSIGEELGVDPRVILETSHGRRSIDVLKILNPEKANWEYVLRMEALIPKLYGASAIALPGSHALLAQLGTLSSPWAIVTSGTTPLVTGWFKILNIPSPPVLITAEGVEHGKPDPQGYSMGRAQLGLGRSQPGRVLVLEDAPAGIRAGKAAGCKVLAVVTSHTVEQVRDAGADWIVKDLASVRAVRKGEGEKGVVLEIRDAWRA